MEGVVGTLAGCAFALAGVAGGAFLAVFVAGAAFAGVSSTFSASGAFAKSIIYEHIGRKRTYQKFVAAKNQPLRYCGHHFRGLPLISESKK